MVSELDMKRAFALGRASRVNPRPMDFPQPFSAVLLAGGRSTRMGQDKAGLIIDGQPLWQRQWAKLEALGAGELFFSGKAGVPDAADGRETIEDPVADAGPISGIVAALRRASHPWLLVLAVDLPDVPSSLLADLLREAMLAGAGRVPAREEWLQPLAAVYPRACLPIAEECLAGSNRSVRRFFRRASQAGLAAGRPVSAEEQALFRNLNAPEDVVLAASAT